MLFLELVWREITDYRVQSAALVYLVGDVGKPGDYVGVGPVVIEIFLLHLIVNLMKLSALPLSYGLTHRLTSHPAMFGKFSTIGFNGVLDSSDRNDECSRAVADSNRTLPAALPALSRASRVASNPAGRGVQIARESTKPVTMRMYVNGEPELVKAGGQKPRARLGKIGRDHCRRSAPVGRFRASGGSPPCD
jgi:hypothetical protein